MDVGFQLSFRHEREHVQRGRRPILLAKRHELRGRNLVQRRGSVFAHFCASG